LDVKIVIIVDVSKALHGWSGRLVVQDSFQNDLAALTFYCIWNGDGKKQSLVGLLRVDDC
jgi:hypothetical protein